MQAAILSPRFGLQWILDGMAIFRRQPLTIFFLSLAINLLFIFTYLIPLLGQIVLIAAMPAITFIILSATQAINQGQQVRYGMWLSPLRESAVRRQFLRLGLSYLGVCLVGGLLSTLPFLSELARVLDAQETFDEQAFLAAVQLPLMTFIALYVLISAAFWHAPALMGWHKLALGQALFYSIVACWRNKWAFLVYGICWAALFYMAQLAGSLLAALGLGDSSLQFLMTPINLALAGVLYCTFYPIYTSTFGHQSAA